jgi:hypothetical protein
MMHWTTLPPRTTGGMNWIDDKPTGLIVKFACAVIAPLVAVIVAVVCEITFEVATVKFTDVAPAGIVAVGGT